MGWVGEGLIYLLPCSLISDFLNFDMQPDHHVLKKSSFDLLIPPQGRGGGRVKSVGKIFATMLLHS